MVWLDVYVLCGARDLETVKRFRARWLGGMSEASEDYVFPRYAEPPEATYVSPWELCERLVREPGQPYGIYWTAETEAGPRAAMLFFTTDAGMIAGLSLADPEPRETGRALTELAASVDGRFGMTLWEEPPGDLAADFVAAVRETKWPRLVDGELHI